MAVIIRGIFRLLGGWVDSALCTVGSCLGNGMDFAPSVLLLFPWDSARGLGDFRVLVCNGILEREGFKIANRASLR
jgi:hypothetical protein